MKAQRLLVITAALLISLGAIPFAGAADMPVALGVLKGGEFAAPDSCSCHSSLQNQWRKSMHSKALEDPIYQLVLGEAKKDGGEAVGQFCETCHAPQATMQNIVADAHNTNESSITCSFCHEVSAQLEKEPANTSLGFPAAGPDGTRRAQLADPQAPHPAAESELHKSAEFCGACHNVNHPTSGIPLESTYTEWKETQFAKDGIVCQNCHMNQDADGAAPFSGSAAMGAPNRDNLFAMTFAGANVAQGDEELSEALLKRAAEVSIDVEEIVASGQSTKATVSVSNNGAGHDLPTGLTEVRQMWLQINLTDEAGNVTELGKTQFKTVLKDDKGNSDVQVWNATGVESDNRIKSGETFTQDVDITVPANYEKCSVSATLNYQSAPDEVAKAAGVENPTTIMASAETGIFPNAEARAAADKKAEEENPFIFWVLGVGISALVLIAAIIVVVMRSKKKKNA